MLADRACLKVARLKFSPNLQLNDLESRLQDHDGQIGALIDAIRSLMSELPGRRKPPIGYHTESKRRRRQK